MVEQFNHGSCGENCTHDQNMNETSPKSEAESSDYYCEFDCNFQGKFQEVKMHENECPKREEITIQRWSNLTFEMWSKNDIVLDEIKNE